VIRSTHVNRDRLERLGNSSLEFRIQPSQQNRAPLPLASMDRDNMITACEELEASGFVKSVTRQMQLCVVPGTAQTLEQVKTEVIPGDGACDLGRAYFDAAAMRGEDCYR
jgi:hypothetical protein